MAELLVMLEDNTNDKITDPALKARGLFLRGHVLAVKPDGWAWGAKERNNPKFYILEVPDATVEEMTPYLRRLLGRGPSTVVTVPDAEVDNAWKPFGDRDDIFDWEVLRSADGMSDVEVFLNVRHNIRELRIDDAQLPDMSGRKEPEENRVRATKQEVVDATVQQPRFPQLGPRMPGPSRR